jgi:hypothetical protein
VSARLAAGTVVVVDRAKDGKLIGRLEGIEDGCVHLSNALTSDHEWISQCAIPLWKVEVIRATVGDEMERYEQEYRRGPGKESTG